jgi:virginiamycin B lyase
MNRSQRTLVLAGVLTQVVVVSASAADIKGRVNSGGAPVRGALVSALAEDGRAVTVYTSGDGRFEIDDAGPGPHRLRIRHPAYDQTLLDTIPSSGDLQVSLRASGDSLMQAPSSQWLGLLPDGVMKSRLILNCTSCHTLAGDRIHKDGRIRDQSQWTQAIDLMKAIDGYSLIPDDFDTQAYARWLAVELSSAKIGTLPRVRADVPVRGSMATITEFPVPLADELLHDVALGPDGRVWITAFFHGEMWSLEPDSGGIERFDLKAGESPSLEVRALQFDRDGRLWIVLGGTKTIVRLDPRTRKIDRFPIGIYAHDLILDSRGSIWANDYFSNPERIARLDPATGEVVYYALPSANRPPQRGKPLPYGMQIDAQDRLWCTQLGADTLVQFDTRTLETRLYRMPVESSGPRRLGIARDGSVWIPEYATGFVTRFDPAAERFERIDLGDSSLGPYALAIDPRDEAIWITGTLSSELVRLDPRTRAIERYPLPSEPAYMRHLAIDPRNGDVWTAYAAYPAAAPKVVRLRRDGSRP